MYICSSSVEILSSLYLPSDHTKDKINSSNYSCWICYLLYHMAGVYITQHTMVVVWGMAVWGKKLKRGR